MKSQIFRNSLFHNSKGHPLMDIIFYVFSINIIFKFLILRILILVSRIGQPMLWQEGLQSDIPNLLSRRNSFSRTKGELLRDSAIWSDFRHLLQEYSASPRTQKCLLRSRGIQLGFQNVLRQEAVLKTSKSYLLKWYLENNKSTLNNLFFAELNFGVKLVIFYFPNKFYLEAVTIWRKTEGMPINVGGLD